MSGVFTKPVTTGSILIADLPEPDWPIYEYTRDGANAALNTFEPIDPPSVTTIVSPAADASGRAFWQSVGQGNGLYLGLVLARNGKMYSPPYSEGGNVLVVDPSTNNVTVQSFGVSGYTYNGENFITGAVAPNGKIYCPPFNTQNHILVLNPDLSTSYTISIGATPSACYGTAVLGTDGKIYCVGKNDCLIINPINDTFVQTTFGGVIPNSGASQTLRWHSGVRCLADDKLYFVSAQLYDYLIVIDPATNTASRQNFGSYAMSVGQRYSGIANGKNGLLNLAPDQCTNFIAGVQKRYWTYVNPLTGTATDEEITNQGNVTFTASGGAVVGNDGGVYSIPGNLNGSPNKTYVQFTYNRTGVVGNVEWSRLGVDITNIDTGPAGWWGGCLAPNGKIYSLPDMSYWLTSRNNILRTSILVLDAGGNAIDSIGGQNFRTLIDTSYFNKGGS